MTESDKTIFQQLELLFLKVFHSSKLTNNLLHSFTYIAWWFISFVASQKSENKNLKKMDSQEIVVLTLVLLIENHVDLVAGTLLVYGMVLSCWHLRSFAFESKHSVKTFFS